MKEQLITMQITGTLEDNVIKFKFISIINLYRNYEIYINKIIIIPTEKCSHPM